MSRAVPSGRNLPPLSTLHFEQWVALRADRDRIRRVLRKTYRIARKVTSDGGGGGPWVFLVDPDPPSAKTPRLRRILGLRQNEDLWIELVYYPNKARMKGIIRQIWNNPGFMTVVSGLDGLVSKRKVGFDSTLAYAVLQKI